MLVAGRRLGRRHNPDPDALAPVRAALPLKEQAAVLRALLEEVG
jgi:hypothetical protein